MVGVAPRFLILIMLGQFLVVNEVAATPVDEGITTLPDLTITGVGEDGPAAWANTAAVTTVSNQELNQSGKRDIASVLQGQAGVATNSVNRGFPARFSIRGSSSALGMVTMDGIPMFSANHNLVALAPFSAESIGSMEVIRGPMAYRYGNTALGGAVRLASRDAKTSNAFLKVEGGSFDTASETLGGSYAGNQGQATVTLNRDDIFTGTNISSPGLGNTEKDGFYSTSAIGRYTLFPTGRLKLDGTLLYANSKAKLDNFTFTPCPNPGHVNKGATQAYPCNWLGSVDSKNAFNQIDTWLAQQSAALTVSPHWLSTLQLGLSQSANDTLLQAVPFQFTNRLLLALWENQHDYSFGHHDGSKLSLRWGADIREETGDGQAVYKGLGKRLIAQQRTTVAGFADVDLAIQQWQASAGVRFNRYNDLGTHPNYYLGLAWQALLRLKLHGSAGVGYRPPSINQMWMPVIGNPLLKPERVVSGELGGDWKLADNVKISLTGYISRYKNLIAYVPAQNPLNHVNSENVNIRGLEWELRYSPWQTLNLGIDYTYTDVRNTGPKQQLTNLPEHGARFFGTWQASQVPVSVYAEGVYTSGWQWQNSPLTTVGVADRIRLNAQVNYQIRQNLTLYVRGENLNDDQTPINPSFGTQGVGVYVGARLVLF